MGVRWKDGFVSVMGTHLAAVERMNNFPKLGKSCMILDLFHNFSLVWLNFIPELDYPGDYQMCAVVFHIKKLIVFVYFCVFLFCPNS